METPKKRGDRYWALLNDNSVLVDFMTYVWGKDAEEGRNNLMAHRAGKRVEIILPEDELREMVASGMSKVEIGKHFGVSQSKIYKDMKKYGIIADQQGKHVKTKDLNLEEVKYLIEKGYTKQEIAWRCKVGTTKLYKFMKENKLGGYADDKTKSKKR